MKTSVIPANKVQSWLYLVNGGGRAILVEQALVAESYQLAWKKQPK